jgi:aerobic carbon-monoxide dehydrogenase large subunit
VHMALEKVTAKASRIAAHLLDAKPDQVTFDGESFRVAGSERKLGFRQVAEAAHLWNVPIPGEEPGLEAVARFEPTGTTFPFGAHFCEVEIDPDTGALRITRYASVDDVGRCINPLIVHGQTHGGIAQGVGQAMWELCHIDPASGQPLMGSLMDYGMPRTDNLPSFETEIVEVLSPTNPLGIKAGGEGGTTPALSAIVNAILDATWELGVRDIEMPCTPHRVWCAIQAAKR